jgi:glycosyltransferase involved in cell wall biosynthesis
MRIIVAHSHLRWDFVWQRPQQVLSRMARWARVLFVEEPLFDAGRVRPSLDATEPTPGVTRLVPRLPEDLRGDECRVAAIVRESVRRRLGDLPSNARIVHWFYTPMPAPAMLGAFDEDAVVYDCMDELSAFRFAPPSLPEREALLLSAADVVFTGGPRLYDAKSRQHSNVHCFGCGVDAAHFARALDGDVAIPGDIAALPGPVLGYVGVVDERLNYGLIARLAEARAWSVVIVGPTVKVDPAELPRAPNLHWLGARSYEALPAYLKGFDVALMPFALNEATNFINPTKTLEYMAAGRPIVSTPIADVVRQFASIVRIAVAPEDFIACCEQPFDAARVERGRACAAGRSWDTTVHHMAALVDARLPDRLTRAAG